MSADWRTCSQCGETKPWSEFPPNKRDEDGNVIRTRAQCRICFQKLRRAYHQRERVARTPMNGRPRTASPSEWARTKRCPHCGIEKAWALFSPARYWPDGTVRTVKTYCRACEPEVYAEARKAYKKRNRQRLSDESREWKRRRREQLRREQGRGAHLPVEPFRAWLERVKAEEDSLVSLAQDAGVHPDTLGKICGEDGRAVAGKRFVSESIAEAVVCARGLRLDDIYKEDLAA